MLRSSSWSASSVGIVGGSREVARSASGISRRLAREVKPTPGRRRVSLLCRCYIAGHRGALGARSGTQELRVDEFDPTTYHDAFRERLEQAAREKAKGRTLEIGEPASARAPVIDLMEALQESLRKPPVKARGREGASVIASPAARPAKRRKRGAA